MSALFRDPAGWARDWGWLSPRKAANRARELREIADAIASALDDDGAAVWVKAIRAVADKVDPAKVVESTKRRNRRRIQA